MDNLMTFPEYSREELGQFFREMCDRTTDGVPGFVRIEGNAPGPVLGITACTHGNEPSGLAALKFLMEEVEIERGTLYLGVNNLRATEQYFSAVSDLDRQKARFTEHYMNRLPENLEDFVLDERYEIRRALSLLPIFRRFDVGFDIHSTSQDSRPMIITGGNRFHADLVKGFPIVDVLSNIDVVQIGLPVFGFFGPEGGSIPVFEIEAGRHETSEAFGRAIRCALALLRNLEMIPGKSEAVVDAYNEYRICSSVVFPSAEYSLTRTFADFELVPSGTVFASNGTVGLTAVRDCHTFFCPADKGTKNVKDETIFLSEPVRLQMNT